MKTRLSIFVFLTLLPFLSGCGAYLNQPMKTSRARLGEETPFNAALRNLPPPQNPIVVSVYKFRDQTGQYKPSEFGSSWSTAVTQGGTNILIKSLMDSGWFTVIERENVGNLLNERKIIRQTRLQYGQDEEKQLLITPLLFASLIIEGGIVSYDANIVTGGAGVRYFGAGGSGKYRQDRVTVFLRAVATKTGKIVKNVYTSKTILSQAIDGGLFRFVKFSRLLEVETGFTYNEPADMAVTEAIEKAVYSLIMEGIQDGLWSTVVEGKEGELNSAIAAYEQEKDEVANIDILGREYRYDQQLGAISANGTGLYYQGDIPEPEMTPGIELGVNILINPQFSFRLGIGKSNLSAEREFGEAITYFDGNVSMRLLPHDRLSPFLYGGAGLLLTDENASKSNLGSNAIFKLNAGLGLEYYLTDFLGLELALDQNYLIDDTLDGVNNGKYNDYFFRARLGVKFYLNQNKKDNNK